MTWNLRELVLIAAIREAGHDPVSDAETGWATCPNCHVSWFVSKRALIASGEVTADPGWAEPTEFGSCYVNKERVILLTRP